MSPLFCASLCSILLCRWLVISSAQMVIQRCPRVCRLQFKSRSLNVFHRSSESHLFLESIRKRTRKGFDKRRSHDVSMCSSRRWPHNYDCPALMSTHSARTKFPRQPHHDHPSCSLVHTASKQRITDSVALLFCRIVSVQNAIPKTFLASSPI